MCNSLLPLKLQPFIHFIHSLELTILYFIIADATHFHLILIIINNSPRNLIAFCPRNISTLNLHTLIKRRFPIYLILSVSSTFSTFPIPHFLFLLFFLNRLSTRQQIANYLRIFLYYLTLFFPQITLLKLHLLYLILEFFDYLITINWKL